MTTLALTQPTIGSTSWGSAMNTNIGALDTGTGLGQINLYSPVAIAGATTLTSTAFGKIHALSGTTAAYTVTLPAAAAGNVGSMIAFRGLPNASLNQVVTIARSGTDVMDGLTSLAVLWDELLVLLCTAAGTWTRVIWKTQNRWQSYVPTINADTTNPTKGGSRVENCFWRRDGGEMVLNFLYRQNTAGTAGSGNYKFLMPGGFSIDTSFAVPGTDSGTLDQPSVVGYGHVGIHAVANRVCIVRAYDSTSLWLCASVSPGDTDTTPVNSGFFQLSNTTLAISFQARVPIAGWGG